MPVSNENQLDPGRRQLLEKKLGSLLAWTVPEFVETVGPFDLSPFEKFDARRREIIERCVARLLEFSDVEVNELLAARTLDRNAALLARPDGDQERVRQVWDDFQSSEISQLRWHGPSRMSGGFGHPRLRADIQHWARMPHFKLQEIILLSVGVEPDRVDLNDLERRRKRDTRALLASELFLIRRHEQFRRKFNPLDYGGHIRPQEFLNWVDAVELDVDAEFIAQLRRFHHRSAQQAPEPGVAEQDKREVDKIAQLFTAMAIDQLGYNPRDARSPIPREITELVASMGLAVSAETVRKYLRLGADFIPEDWEPK